MNVYKSGFLILVLSNIATVINYACMVFLSRTLTKADFATYTSISALSPILISWASVIPYFFVLVINDVSNTIKVRAKIVVNVFSCLIICSLFFVLFYFCFTDYISENLKISDQTPVYLYGITIFLTLIILNVSGFALGYHKYHLIQLKDFTLSSVKFSLLVSSFYLFSSTVTTMVVVELVASLVGLLVLIYCTYDLLIDNFRNYVSDTRISNTVYIRKSLPLTMNHILVGVLIASDLLLAKYFLSENDAADYSVASNFAKVSLFVSGAIAGIVFPVVIKYINDKKNIAPPILLSFLVCLVSGGGFALVVYFFSEQLITFVFGVKYIDSADILLYMSLAMMALSLNIIFFNFFLACQFNYYIFFSFTLIMIFLLKLSSIEHLSALSLAQYMTIVYWTILAFNLVAFSAIIKFKKSIVFNLSINKLKEA